MKVNLNLGKQIEPQGHSKCLTQKGRTSTQERLPSISRQGSRCENLIKSARDKKTARICKSFERVFPGDFFKHVMPQKSLQKRKSTLTSDTSLHQWQSSHQKQTYAVRQTLQNNPSRRYLSSEKCSSTNPSLNKLTLTGVIPATEIRKTQGMPVCCTSKKFQESVTKNQELPMTAETSGGSETEDLLNITFGAGFQQQGNSAKKNNGLRKLLEPLETSYSLQFPTNSCSNSNKNDELLHPYQVNDLRFEGLRQDDSSQCQQPSHRSMRTERLRRAKLSLREGCF